MVGIIKIRGNHRTSRSKRDCTAGGTAAPANGAIVSAISNIRPLIQNKHKLDYLAQRQNVGLEQNMNLNEGRACPAPTNKSVFEPVSYFFLFFGFSGLPS